MKVWGEGGRGTGKEGGVRCGSRPLCSLLCHWSLNLWPVIHPSPGDMGRGIAYVTVLASRGCWKDSNLPRSLVRAERHLAWMSATLTQDSNPGAVKGGQIITERR
ncbi:hypothetical protein E2C01_098551 [Portunus trituberculatus]|uniref:Uncharacterized protein n=1 Tax=Portunus trituberculatus TaxID=210409 RepID=A0A5B7JY42_PORTR|nr:hypothetical protein [Portunus trituberculatus]